MRRSAPSGGARAQVAALLLLASLTACARPAAEAEPPAAPPQPWPPRVGETYPDLELSDPAGRPTRLSAFSGKVLLIEPIGMSCPACNAFAGAGEKGGFRGVRPQRGLGSIAEYLPAYGGGVRLDHPELVFVQLLLYDLEMGAPSREEAQAWADHFGSEGPNHHVLFGDERYINRASYEMIPGFQLVDRDFRLVSDSTGHRPRHDLYRHLLPMAGRLAAGAGR